MNRHRIIVVVLLSVLSIAAHTVTRTVALDGSQQYTSIQTAVSAASPGDTVLVYPGRYLERVLIQTNGISLVSLETVTGNPAYIDSTIIESGLTYPCIWVDENIRNVKLRGLSVTNSRTGILLADNSTSSITNCSLFGNKSSYGGGKSVWMHYHPKWSSDI